MSEPRRCGSLVTVQVLERLSGVCRPGFYISTFRALIETVSDWDSHTLSVPISMLGHSLFTLECMK